MLAALWRHGPLSFTSLIEVVQLRRPWGGATIKTLLNRLMNKGVIRSARDDGRQLYHPLISRTDYARSEISELAERIYDGDEQALLSALND